MRLLRLCLSWGLLRLPVEQVLVGYHMSADVASRLVSAPKGPPAPPDENTKTSLLNVHRASLVMTHGPYQGMTVENRPGLIRVVCGMSKGYAKLRGLRPPCQPLPAYLHAFGTSLRRPTAQFWLLCGSCYSRLRYQDRKPDLLVRPAYLHPDFFAYAQLSTLGSMWFIV